MTEHREPPTSAAPREPKPFASIDMGSHNEIAVQGDVVGGDQQVFNIGIGQVVVVVASERGASRASLEETVQSAFKTQVAQAASLMTAPVAPTTSSPTIPQAAPPASPQIYLGWGTVATPAPAASASQLGTSHTPSKPQWVSVDQASLIHHKRQLLVGDTLVLPVLPDEDATLAVFGGKGLYTVRLRLDAAGNLHTQSWLGGGFEVQPSAPDIRVWPVGKARHKWRFERCASDEMHATIQNIHIAFSPQAVLAVWRIWHQRDEFREEKFLIVLGKL